MDSHGGTVEFKPELSLILIDHVLRVFPQDDVDRGRCVARSGAGIRCPHHLSYLHLGPPTVWQLPGDEPAYVVGTDLDVPGVFVGKDRTAETLKARLLGQRCRRHRHAGDVAAEPEWETFDLDTHRPLLSLVDVSRFTRTRVVPLPWPADVARSLLDERRSANTDECPF
jgi:hypothetical protein